MSTLKGTTMHPRCHLITNEGAMVQFCQNINVRVVVNTDIF